MFTLFEDLRIAAWKRQSFVDVVLVRAYVLLLSSALNMIFVSPAASALTETRSQTLMQSVK